MRRTIPVSLYLPTYVRTCVSSSSTVAPLQKQQMGNGRTGEVAVKKRAHDWKQIRQGFGFCPFYCGVKRRI